MVVVHVMPASYYIICLLTGGRRNILAVAVVVKKRIVTVVAVKKKVVTAAAVTVRKMDLVMTVHQMTVTVVVILVQELLPIQVDPDQYTHMHTPLCTLHHNG